MLVWARRRCGGGGTSLMHGSVADRRRGARAVRFSHVDFLTELGIGIAIGMLAGTTGTHGSARGRMTLLAAVIGLVAGFLLDGPLGAAARRRSARSSACVVVSDLVAGAGRREGSGSGALGFIVALAALIVIAALSLLAAADRPRRARPWSGSGSPATAAPSANTPACASCARARRPSGPVDHHSSDGRVQEARPHLRRLAAHRHAASGRSPRSGRRPSPRCSSAGC